MRKTSFLVVLLSVCLYSCSDDDSNFNALQESGIIGEWEINGKGINQIVSTESFCCETLIFTEDDNENDLKGNYIYSLNGETYGDFIIDTESNLITVTTENGNSNTEAYVLNENTLELWYYENENRYWSLYRKVIED